MPPTLNGCVRKAEADSGKRAGVPTDMAGKLKALERENRELRQAKASPGRARACLALAAPEPAPMKAWFAAGRIPVADLRGTPAGVVGVPPPDGDWTAEPARLFVAPRFQRWAIATAPGRPTGTPAISRRAPPGQEGDGADGPLPGRTAPAGCAGSATRGATWQPVAG